MSRPVLIVGFVIALTIGVFVRTLGHDFIVWDDDKNIYQNPHLREASLAGVGRFWIRPYQGLYIPVTYTAWWLLARVAGTDVSRGAGTTPVIASGPFHAANLLLHLGSIALVIALFHRILGRQDLFAACAGAALFAFHPLQVESVAWATGLKDVLSAFLALVCLFLYLRYAKELQAARLRSARLAFTGALLVYIAALLSKPQLVILPAVIAIVLFLDRSDTWRTAWKNRAAYLSLLPFCAAALAAVAVTMSVQPDQDAIFKFDVPPIWQRPIVALDALAFYLAKLVYPFMLSIDYGRNPAVALRIAGHAPIWAAPLVAASLLLLFRTHRRLVIASGAIAFVAILPNLGLIPFAYQGQSTVADRYVYLGMIGVGLFVTAILTRARAGLPRYAALAALCVLAFISAGQAAHWKDTVRLLTHAIEVNPRAVGPTYNLALCHSNDGEIDTAIHYYRKAIELKGDFVYPWNNLGLSYNATGRHREAIPCLERAIALDSSHPGAHLNLGISYSGIGEHDKAIDHYHKALELDPQYAAAFINLGASWLLKQDFAKALDYFRKGALLSPGLPQPQNGIGESLMKLQDFEGALEAYRKLVALEPDQALNWRKLALAHAHLGRFPEAAQAAARSIELAQESSPVAPAMMDLLLQEHRNYLAGRIE